MYLAFLGFYSIVTAFFIVSYIDYDLLKRFKARRASRRIDNLKAGQLVFLSSIVQYSGE